MFSFTRTLLSLFLVKVLILSTLLVIFVEVDIEAEKVYVRGYYRSDGTYVKPHYRTAPDGNPFNNYSFPGNYNPNKGTWTTGDPFKYLERYYNRKKPTRPVLNTWKSPTIQAPQIPDIAEDMLKILQSEKVPVRSVSRRTYSNSQFYEVLLDEIKRTQAQQRLIHQREIAALQKRIKLIEQRNEALKQQLLDRKARTQYNTAIANGNYSKALLLSYGISNFDPKVRERLRAVIASSSFVK